MPSSWSETRAELEEWPKLANGHIDYDGFRRSEYKAIAEHTGRPLIVFATDFLNKDKV